MRVDLAKFSELYQKLFDVDYFGSVPGICPSLASVASIRAATAKGAPFLPMLYHHSYFEQVDARLPDVMSKLKQQVARGERTPEYMAMVLEAVYGAVYQHGHRVSRVEAYPQLKRFLAVVSNLYRSFVDANKRTAAGVTLSTETPPLAMFQSTPIRGPFTIEADLMMEKFGTPIGMVSLPATYRDHPVLWACLSHEVGGHDVVHADVGLVEEMQAKTLVKNGNGGEIKSFDDFSAPFLALQNGQVDAVIVDNTTFGEQKKVTPNIRVIGDPMSLAANPDWQSKQDAAGYKFGGDGIGVRKEDTALLAALNQALDDMDAEGVRQKILEKYGLWDASLSREAMMGK